MRRACSSHTAVTRTSPTSRLAQLEAENPGPNPTLAPALTLCHSPKQGDTPDAVALCEGYGRCTCTDPTVREWAQVGGQHPCSVACALHVGYMRAACGLHVVCMWALHAHFIRTACPLHVHVHCMHTACTLHSVSTARAAHALQVAGFLQHCMGLDPALRAAFARREHERAEAPSLHKGGRQKSPQPPQKSRPGVVYRMGPLRVRRAPASAGGGMAEVGPCSLLHALSPCSLAGQHRCWAGGGR